MTATPSTPDPAPASGTQASNYVLFGGAELAQRFDRSLTWSFYQADTGEEM